MHPSNFLKLFEPSALAREMSSPRVGSAAAPACVVCGRSDVAVMEWYGCRRSCALCADYFRRVCAGSAIFAQPEECLTGFRWAISLSRLNHSFTEGMIPRGFDLGYAVFWTISAPLFNVYFRSLVLLLRMFELHFKFTRCFLHLPCFSFCLSDHWLHGWIKDKQHPRD